MEIVLILHYLWIKEKVCVLYRCSFMTILIHRLLNLKMWELQM